ncbi:hypothetical protein B0G57_1418 [Trinickia symbiotica]|uniref:Uncharacterized protein n=1 Tax=Trinickia symbiotica TaxID=863227 RepID=A0A2N7WKT2_9BURK|nr:hypothetical protein [Trinickia symbiotica]PMS29885.1 hypothetical protein C0Z20_30485 [Trinickia symbiotica]PPK41080.1 hypothetical protein B0G57_1418 [Trinickia symbiotica]
MSFQPLAIKPSRTHARLPDLNYSRAAKNARKGVETTVVLDLNILSKMHEVMTGQSTFETSGLQRMVSKFNKLPITLSPGFALAEVSKEYADALWTTWEAFLAKYCPQFVDTPNATKEKENHARGAKFDALPDGDRHVQAIAYLAILTIQVVDECGHHLSPEEKFSSYVDYMCMHADMLSAVEAEVARFCFFAAADEKDKAFANFARIIRRNFMKTGSIEERLRKALNSARDIIYYRGVAMRSNEQLDGRIQDTWLLTADEGLKNLARSIYFVPGFHGSDSKAVWIVRGQAQKRSPYWKHCDELFDKLNAQRARVHIGRGEPEWHEEQFHKIFDCIKLQEDKLRELYPD